MLLTGGGGVWLGGLAAGGFRQGEGGWGRGVRGAGDISYHMVLRPKGTSHNNPHGNGNRNN